MSPLPPLGEMGFTPDPVWQEVTSSRGACIGDGGEVIVLLVRIEVAGCLVAVGLVVVAVIVAVEQSMNR